jgi:hypothetical protein
MANITPLDPVTLGMCSQIELDDYVAKAAKREERRLKRLAKENGTTVSEVLKEAEETTAIENHTPVEPAPMAEEPVAADVFSDTPSSDDASDATEEVIRPEDVFKSN